jgi:hypothetical protein
MPDAASTRHVKPLAEIYILVGMIRGQGVVSYHTNGIWGRCYAG